MGRDATAYPAPLQSDPLLDAEECRKAGAYRFVHFKDQPDVQVGIKFGCPCGCQRLCQVYFRERGRGFPEWDVAGEWPVVCLYPAISIRNDGGAGDHWHGYLDHGVFVER